MPSLPPLAASASGAARSMAALLAVAGGLVAACPVPDADADGSPDAEGCAPSDPAIHPGSPDPWGDGADTNCDDSDGTDADGDGWTYPLRGPDGALVAGRFL